MTTDEFVKNYHVLETPIKRETLHEIINNQKIDEIYELVSGPHARVATRILADADDRIEGFVKKRAPELLKLLESDDPKVRMHTAQIIGKNCAAQCLDDLVAALCREKTFFTLPSYLLAIGNAKTLRAKEFLESYDLRSDLDKHLFEEKAALNKALSNFVTREKVTVRVLPTDIIALSTPNLNVTYNQCFNMGYKPQKFGKYIAVNQVSDFYGLYKMRAFRHAYIYLGKCKVEELPAFLHKRENAIIQRTGARGYRLEVRSVSHQIRLDIIKKCVNGLKELQNSPSSYSIEIMVEIDENGMADVFLNTLTDERFTYRKKAVPASIAPGVAACVCAYASEYFDPDARVLDNFCGSGTMLYERGYYPHHSLTGVDISLKAIEAANENNTASYAHPQFHYMDALKFTNKKYDEILTNMPFGLRVGSHAKNEKLYRAYFSILPDLLHSCGLAVLYTHEKQLASRLIKDSGAFEILKRATFEAGGLYPAVYVLRKQ
jgi:predicted RNA methylase